MASKREIAEPKPTDERYMKREDGSQAKELDDVKSENLKWQAKAKQRKGGGNKGQR
jgi:hypothetical protein